jgi:tetratricopeptide (TPR) repeat protein
VNLELARLAVLQNDMEGAMRYYTAAIYGVWESDPAGQRSKARIEFAEYLLKHGRQADAQGELIAMAAALPPDPAEHTQAGEMLLRAGENDQALKQFKIAFDEDPRTPGAFRGAGVAEFQLGEYGAAANYLARAEHEAPLDAQAQGMLVESQDVLALDPFSASLPAADRAQRAARAFQLALNRLQSCASSRNESLNEAPGTTPLQQLYGQAQKQIAVASENGLTRHPENLSSVMDLVFQMEAAATAGCGSPAGADAALALIARNGAKATQ